MSKTSGSAELAGIIAAPADERSNDLPDPRLALKTSGAFAVILGLAALVFLARFLGPAEWSDGYHQERAVAYVMDLLFNGQWRCQTGIYGEITSKPPLFTWLVGLSCLAFGARDFSLMLPSACATAGLSMVIFFQGRKYFGAVAGMTGAVLYLLSPLGAKEIVLIRIDVLFSFLVAASALCAFAAWQTGRGWHWFWLLAALATLAKGPLGLVLGGTGLLAIFWERRVNKDVKIRGSHFGGVALYLLLCGGWFAAAYLKMGKPLLQVMLGQELVGHVVQEKGGGLFSQFYLPFLYVCRCFVPWIIFALAAFWRLFKAPAVEPSERRFERFLFVWFAAGLFIFSAAAHQRPDLIFPLLPPVALLAGRELARHLGKATTVQLLGSGAGIALVAISLMIAKYHFLDRDKDPETRTRAMRQMAAQIETSAAQMPLSHVDSPVALQFYLKTKHPLISATDAASLLNSQAPALVATRSAEQVRQILGTNGPPIYELFSWTGRKDHVTVFSNRSGI